MADKGRLKYVVRWSCGGKSVKGVAIEAMSAEDARDSAREQFGLDGAVAVVAELDCEANRQAEREAHEEPRAKSIAHGQCVGLLGED